MISKKQNRRIIVRQNHIPDIHWTETQPDFNNSVNKITPFKKPKLDITIVNKTREQGMMYKEQSANIISNLPPMKQPVSPVVYSWPNQTPDESPILTTQGSPILKRRPIQLIRKIRLRKRTISNANLIPIKDGPQQHNWNKSWPICRNLFSTKPDHEIETDESFLEDESLKQDFIENSNPERLQPTPEITNTQTITEKMKYRIEPFPSQEKTAIDCDINEFLYNSDVQPHRKRKRYKKGGFAKQLQKSLQRQVNGYHIWKHEQYLKTCNNDLSESCHLTLYTSKVWTEFGMKLVHCFVTPSDDNSILKINKNECIVIVGINVETSMEEGNNYKVYPPFGSKISTYKDKNVDCLYNVSRIVQFTLCHEDKL